MSGKVGFVSLGCPNARVDSERFLTELRGTVVRDKPWTPAVAAWS